MTTKTRLGCSAVLPSLLASIVLVCGVSPARAEPPATQPAEQWSTNQVKFDERDDGWKAAAPKAGLYPIADVVLDNDPAVYPYTMAAAGRLAPGAGTVIGHFAPLFPDESLFTVTRFGRVGQHIHLAIEQRDRGGKPTGFHPKGKYLFFSARLPIDLRDGHYDITCELVHVDTNEVHEKPQTLTASFDRADPLPYVRTLQHLSDQDLLAEYIASGTALKDAAVGPREASVVGILLEEMQDVRSLRWQESRAEILRRPEMAPLLMDLLKREVPRNAAAGDSLQSCPFGFARDLMELLAEFHDARLVPLLIEIMEGSGGQANAAVRRAARQSLETLTYTSFIPRPRAEYRTILPHAAPKGVPEWRDGNDPEAEYAYCATAYRTWLAGEGKDATQWLSLARRRGRAMLIRRMLPDLPHPLGDYPWEGAGYWWFGGHVKRDAFRVAWLAEHRSMLRYDESAGAFVLAGGQ